MTTMTRHDIEERVYQVLALVLKLPEAPTEPVVRADVADWDSLNHVEIIYAVEESLGFSFTLEEMGALDGSVAIVDAAERHLAA